MSKVKDVTLKAGEVTNPAAIAALLVPESDKNAGELRHALGKRIRATARGPKVAYRDVTKDFGKSHDYDRDTANAIVSAMKLPIRFVAGRAKKAQPES